MPNGWEQLTMISAEQLLRALLHAQLHGRAVEMLQALCQPGTSAPSDQVFNSMLDSTVSSAENGDGSAAEEVSGLSRKHKHRHVITCHHGSNAIILSYYHFGSEVQFCWLLYS